MVRGETGFHWAIFLDVWNTSQLRQDLLPFGGWNWSIIRESTLPGEIIFWYRVRSTSYRATTTHTYCKKKNQTSTRNSPWRLILVGFTIISLGLSIHPSIHSASVISTPSHLIPFHPPIHPSLPILSGMCRVDNAHRFPRPFNSLILSSCSFKGADHHHYFRTIITEFPGPPVSCARGRGPVPPYSVVRTAGRNSLVECVLCCSPRRFSFCTNESRMMPRGLGWAGLVGLFVLWADSRILLVV